MLTRAFLPGANKGEADSTDDKLEEFKQNFGVFWFIIAMAVMSPDALAQNVNIKKYNEDKGVWCSVNTTGLNRPGSKDEGFGQLKFTAAGGKAFTLNVDHSLGFLHTYRQGLVQEEGSKEKERDKRMRKRAAGARALSFRD